jgi:hypothetical protein
MGRFSCHITLDQNTVVEAIYRHNDGFIQPNISETVSKIVDHAQGSASGGLDAFLR